MRWRHPILRAFLLLGYLATAQSVARAEEEKARCHVKAILIGATADEKIGMGVTANLRMVEGYLRGLPGFDAASDLITVTKNDDLEAEGIVRVVDNVSVDRQDTLFCYIACHGAYDPDLPAAEEGGGKHYFQLPGGHLRRSTLLKSLKAHKAAFTILISDTCNVQGRFQSDTLTAPPGAVEAIPSPVFEQLLLNQKGVVDVSGSSEDQFGWYRADGGYFTTGMFLALEQLDKEAKKTYERLKDKDTEDGEEFAENKGPNPFARIGWQRFLAAASDSVSRVFQARKRAFVDGPEPKDEGQRENRRLMAKQADQRPLAFEAWDESASIDNTSWTGNGVTMKVLPEGQIILWERGTDKVLYRSKDKEAWKQYGMLVVIEWSKVRYRLTYDVAKKTLQGTWTNYDLEPDKIVPGFGRVQECILDRIPNIP